jgi:hypothetical protein
MDKERIDKLAEYALDKKIPLFLCEPKAPKDRSWLVIWECGQVSPANNGQNISCAMAKSEDRHAGWQCVDHVR